MPINRIILLLFLFFPLLLSGQIIVTVAGNGSPAYASDGSPATASGLYGPICSVADATGNLYIADRGNFKIRKVNALGFVTTIAGTGVSGFSGDGGPATAAAISLVSDMALDASGNLYIGDYNNLRIRKISTSGVMTTVAGNGFGGTVTSGVPATATAVEPLGLATDAAGNLYVGCNTLSYIRKINTSGIITTVAGSGTTGYSGDGGPATNAQFYWIEGIALDASGNIYASDYYTGRIRKITPSGIISTYAGNGSLAASGDGGAATAAGIGYPEGLTVDTGGRVLFCDNYNHIVRMITTAGIISTVAGSGGSGFGGDGGPATAAQLNSPYGICHDAANNFYISDWWNNRIRKIVSNNKPVLFTGGHTQSMTACISSTANPINALLSVIDSDVLQSETWSLITPPTHGTVTAAYSAMSTGAVITPTGLTFTPSPGYSGTDSFRVRIVDGYSADTTKIYVTIIPLPPAITGSITAYVGLYTTLTNASPGGTWVSSNTAIATAGSLTGVLTGIATGTVTVVYTATTGCKISTTVNVLNAAPWVIATVAGTGIAGSTGDGSAALLAQLNAPYHVACDGLGNTYVATLAKIRKINSSGVITTVAGTGTPGYSGDGGPATDAALGGGVLYIKADAAGNVYISDHDNNRLRKVNALGIITSIAGTGLAGFSGDGAAATAAQLSAPCGLAIDIAGNIFISDGGNKRIRKISGSGSITTICGTGSAANTGDGGAATAASVNNSGSITTDAGGNLYLTCSSSVRKISSAGTITTIAGGASPGFSGDGGPATAAQLNYATDVAADAIGNLFIADNADSRIRRINASGIISTVAGSGSGGFSGDHCSATSAMLQSPNGISVDGTGNLIIADKGNNRVRRLTFGNHAPVFTAGHIQTMTVCGIAVADSINIRLAVSDADTGQSESWTLVGAPLHGSVTVAYSSTSTGGTLLPVGLYYTPVAGYSGNDSFKVLVTDCMGGTDSTVIRIAVSPAAVGITGPSVLCIGDVVPFVSVMGSGAWSSSNPGIAAVDGFTGLVSGVAAGEATITCNIVLTCGTITGIKAVTVNPLPAPIAGVVPFCIGTPLTLTDATPGGTWSSSNAVIASIGSASGVVAGASAGTAAISYTLSGGCAVTAIVTVNALPAGISGTLSICAGTSTLLSDVTPGGTWSSASALVSVGSSPPGTVTGISAGTAVISYTLSTGCRITALLTVSAVPASISGLLSFCVGTAATLTDATPGGTWGSSTPSVADVDGSGHVTPVASGLTSIYYMLPSGCLRTALATVNMMPSAITGTLSTCTGSLFLLANTVPGGVWTAATPGVLSLDAYTGAYTGVAAGVTAVSYSVGPVCTATTAVTIHPVPAAISLPASMCSGAAATLTDATPGGFWTSAGTSVVTIGSATGIISSSSPGVTTISYRIADGATCMVSELFTVNPTPGAITGTPSVCQGSATLLSAIGLSGVWSSSSTTVAAVGSATGLVSGISAGTATITYSLSSGCYSVATVTVSAAPAAVTGIDAICVGLSAPMACTTPGGTWSRSNARITIGSTSGIVTGASTGTAVVSYTLPNGCSATKPVTVNSSPGSITGTTRVCPGTTTALINPVPGGVWSCTPSAVAIINPLSGVVSGIVPGIASVTYSLGAGCSATVLVTVSPLPAAISGNVPLCTGSAILLSSPGGGTWSAAGALVTVGSSTGIVTGLADGIASVTYTLASGCSRMASVTVNPLPAAIVGSSILCTGSAITLTNATTGGIWTSTAPAIATVGSSSGYVAGYATGTAFINYTLPTGCFASLPVTVSALPGAIAGAGIVCVGSEAAFSNAISGGLWSSSNTGIAAIGSASGVVTGGTAGTAIISYSLGSGCMVTRPVTVSVGPAAISGSATVCTGASTLMTDVTPGGTWSVSPSFASVSGTGLLSGLAAGVVTVSYNALGCAATKLVTVSPAPASITGPAAVCVGATVLQADATPGGTWSATGAALSVSAGVVTGIAPGFGNVSYTVGGCITGRLITVNPAPAISGATGVCAGSATPMSASIPGGTWSSLTPSVVAVGSLSGIVLGLVIGSGTISYTSLLGCAAAVTVSVTSSPTAIINPGHVCVGSTITLGNGISGGLWTASPAAIATIGSSSGIVYGVSPGVATITYSLGSGCTVSTAVTVHALPLAITGPTELCTGGAATLATATPGGLWSALSPAIAMVPATGHYSALADGVAAVRYTLPTGCFAAASVTVHPLPAAITGAMTVCSGLTTMLSNTAAGGAWHSSFAGIAAIDSATGLVLAGVPGAATITYTLPTGCFITRTIAVDPSPAPITGSDLLCLTASTTLSSTTPGGSWLSGAPGIVSVGTTGLITGMSLGSTQISYTVAGCPAIRSITVNALPAAIAGSSSLCTGATTTFTDAGGGIWSTSSLSVATVGSLSGVVTGIAAGSVTITYTMGIGCAVVKTLTVHPLPLPISGPSAHLCAGASLPLTDASPSGTWSTGTPGIASVSTGGTVTALTGITSGMATISYALPTGCAVTYTIGVIAVPPIAGIHNICAWGDTLMVHDDTTTGIFISSLVSVASLGGGYGRVTANAPGTGSVTYIVPSGCTAVATFTVSPLPAAIVGAGPLCVGGSLSLTSVTAGGLWSSTAPGIAAVGSATGIVSALAEGAAYIRYKLLGTGCKTDTVVHVTALPVAGSILGAGSICAGSSLLLSDTIIGGTWTRTGTSTAITAGLIAATAAGIDTVYYTMSNFCGTAVAAATVTINALPEAGSISGTDSLCAGSAVMLTNTVTGGTWSITNANATISAAGLVSGLAPGADTVIYSVSNAWCTASANYPIRVLPLAACGSLGAQTMPLVHQYPMIWPNPASHTFSVSITEPASMNIYNVQGQLITSFTVMAGTTQLHLPATVTPGIYLLECCTATRHTQTKLVITY